MSRQHLSWWHISKSGISQLILTQFLFEDRFLWPSLTDPILINLFEPKFLGAYLCWQIFLEKILFSLNLFKPDFFEQDFFVPNIFFDLILNFFEHIFLTIFRLNLNQKLLDITFFLAQLILELKFVGPKLSLRANILFLHLKKQQNNTISMGFDTI